MFKVYRWTNATSRKPLCLSAGSYSLYLQLKPTIWAQSYQRKHIKCATRFKNVIFRHHYVMQKNSNCIETEKCYLCKALHFNRQNLMLIGPPNDWATAYGSYWKYPTEQENIAWDVPSNVFLIMLATAISGIPTPEICFLPGRFRRTILPKEHHGESLSVCDMDTQPSSWEADPTTGLSPPQRHLRRQCLGFRGCYDVQLGRYWETNDTRKTVKLALIIYRDFMQKFFIRFWEE